MPRTIAVFFYGSFIRRDVMARGGLNPGRVEVARLSGYDIRVAPHAALVRSDQHVVYGVLVQATHDELNTLYNMDGPSSYLPEAVLVETLDQKLEPAITYLPQEAGTEPADREYLDRIVAAGREYGFPRWYLRKLGAMR